MRAVRNNPNRAHNYFQDFSKCQSIFNKALKLQKNRKRKQRGKRGRESLLGAHPAGPPAGPAQPMLQRAAWLGQAGRQLLDTGTSACHASARRPASSPRSAAALVRSHTSPPSSQTRLSLPSSCPSLSPLAPLSRPPQQRPSHHRRCCSSQPRPTPSPSRATMSSSVAVVDYVN